MIKKGNVEKDEEERRGRKRGVGGGRWDRSGRTYSAKPQLRSSPKKNLMIHVHMGHFTACGHQRDLYVLSQTFTIKKKPYDILLKFDLPVTLFYIYIFIYLDTV